MATPLSFTHRRRDDGASVLTATGEIDMSNVDAFADGRRGRRDAASRRRRLTVDLSGVEYLDSAAINALFAHADAFG